MDIWESSGMWPFSCFAFVRETSSLPGQYNIDLLVTLSPDGPSLPYLRGGQALTPAQR